MKSRIFLFFAIVSVAGMLAMSGCHRDDDEQNGRNGRNGRATGTLSGHDYVDLGLPSGTKWATCNVGANSPEEYGDYFAWGETSTKSTFTEDNYTYTGNPTTLPSSADAATANWGSGWRMPTKADMQELLDNSYYNKTTQNGVNGGLFTGPNGNSIFLPIAGYRDDRGLGGVGSDGIYFTSSLGTYNGSLSSDNAQCLYIFEDTYSLGHWGLLWMGFSVRPVCSK